MPESSRRFAVVLLTAAGLLAAAVILSLSYGMVELAFGDVIRTLLGLATSRESDLLLFEFRQSPFRSGADGRPGNSIESSIAFFHLRPIPDSANADPKKCPGSLLHCGRQTGTSFQMLSARSVMRATSSHRRPTA